jgi:hypothetical protein
MDKIKENLPKRCIKFRENAFKACGVMDDPVICKDIIEGMVNQCNKWLKQTKKNENSVNKKY